MSKKICAKAISIGRSAKVSLTLFRITKLQGGSDGIPIEFYKRFWHLIEEPFISCVNECFEKGELACSQKQAVITLIEKKGKDRLFLENWRPISLLNVDVKIMSKVIATKIKNH